MPDYTASFQYLAPDGSVAQEGDCRFSFDKQSLTLVPSAGASMTLDLGDLDGFSAGKFQIRLPLYTGQTLLFQQLGRAFERVSQDLLNAYRNRAVQCLLLEDMKQIASFPGAFDFAAPAVACSSCATRAHGKFCPNCGKRIEAATAPVPPQGGEAEIRVYETNIAVLPSASQPFQFRLADVDAVQFQPGSYEVTLDLPDRSVRFRELGKRTEDFARTVRDTIAKLSASSAQAIHLIFPFLTPDQVGNAATLLRDGRSAPIAKLTAIHPKIPAALAANAVDTDLKPYYDELVRRCVGGSSYAGFKLVRPEDGASNGAAAESGDEEAMLDADAAGPETLYWFFFPVAAKPGSTDAANLVAWEAASRSGRATYFFRIIEPSQAAMLQHSTRAASLMDASVQRLNAALAMLNFRRRPIYLSDDELDRNPVYHRYAIAARRLPEVRQLRARFVGRALHSSLAAWQEQVNAILAKPA